MQQIADRIGMHVTTVSRAVDDKWLQTPRGLVPLRRFFVGGTVSAAGEEVAWDAVRIKLQEIVQGEPKDSPFCDDELVEELGKRGISVARRTVTKYRKAMKIPSSRQRRDWTIARRPGGPADGVGVAGRAGMNERDGAPEEGDDSADDGDGPASVGTARVAEGRPVGEAAGRGHETTADWGGDPRSGAGEVAAPDRAADDSSAPGGSAVDEGEDRRFLGDVPPPIRRFG